MPLIATTFGGKERNVVEARGEGLSRIQKPKT
jgi:hypothetical protein